MRYATIEELTGIFEEVVDLSGIMISEDSVLGDDIPVNSMEMLRIISRIEAVYGFRFRPEDILSLKTMQDIVIIINSHHGTRRQQ